MTTDLVTEPPHRLMFEAIAIVCVIDWNVATKAMIGRVARTGKKLREAGVEPDDVYAFQGWWNANDWRGKTGQPPLPHQIQESWGRFVQERSTYNLSPSLRAVNEYLEG